jgi:Fe2+ transport system protein FeoA
VNTSEEKWEVKEIPEEEINVPDRLQDIGKKIGEYRDIVVKEFKNMEVDVRTWNFAVGKTEAEYTLEVNLKLALRPKKKQEQTQ